MNQIHLRSSISEIRNSLTNGDITFGEILDYYSGQIHEQNPCLNACIIVLHPQEKVFDLTKPLSGIPLVLKDIFDTKGIATTAGAKFLRNNNPTDDATVVRKLKEAGATIIGKANMHEIALGVTNINPNYGTCRNPWNILHICGGSSGGSAVSVAAGMCIAALGSDTGGSIRIPSSLCGTVGLKPTYGRISMHGVFPLSRNLDHVGPITNCIQDAALILQTIAGYDPTDPTCSDHPVDDYISHLEEGIKDWRIASLQGDYFEESQPDVVTALKDAVLVFNNLGAKVEKVTIPWLNEAALANGIMIQADAAAFHFERLNSSPQDFGEDVLHRLEIGMAYTSSEYSNARWVQIECKRKFKLLFEGFDLLLLPTTPSIAPMIKGSDALEQARKLTRFTAPFNLAGIPAISLPCGYSQEGLPIGLQIVGPEWSEAKVLMAGRAFEGSTQWHERTPQLQS